MNETDLIKLESSISKLIILLKSINIYWFYPGSKMSIEEAYELFKDSDTNCPKYKPLLFDNINNYN